MSHAITLTAAFVLALGATALITPATIWLACRMAFYDHPHDYKQHAAATPYLGGVAVVVGLLVGSSALGSRLGEFDAIIAAAVALLVVGTVDDRVGLDIALRIALETGAAVALFYAGVGWSVFGSEAADLLLTIVFVIGVVNAFNLMDNLDGATSTIALVLSAAIALYTTIEGQVALAALALALTGACAGFLPFNLASPRARIFLGDGGSMAIGITLAGLMMSVPGIEGFGWELIPVIVVFVGLPALDTALVIVSRLRRRVAVLSGGRDHLTHRLLQRLGSTRRVAVVLAGGQAVLSGLAIALLAVDPDVALATSCILIACGMALIVALEGPRWRSPVRATEPAVSPIAASEESPA